MLIRIKGFLGYTDGLSDEVIVNTDNIVSIYVITKGNSTATELLDKEYIVINMVNGRQIKIDDSLENVYKSLTDIDALK